MGSLSGGKGARVAIAQILKRALRGIYKEPLRGTWNRPPQPSLREGIPA